MPAFASEKTDKFAAQITRREYTICSKLASDKRVSAVWSSSSAFVTFPFLFNS